MLSALAGAESLEILVLLKDLSEGGLRKLEANIKSVETRANSTKFGGFSSATKGLAKDAEQAAGSASGGGLGGLISGFLGIPAPVAIAGAAIAGFVALGAAVIPTYEKVEQQEKQLAVAFKDHGMSLDALRPKIDAAIKDGEQYGFNADNTRGAILKLAEAGNNWATIQTALPHIMDLARAKNLDLAEAARMYELALMGNTRALKDLGIALPRVTDAEVQHEKATKAVETAKAALAKAEQHLKDLQAEHTTTTERLSSSTKGAAASSEQLRVAQERVSLAQLHLTEVEGKKKVSTYELASAQARVADAEANLTTLEGKHATTTTKLTTATKGHTASAIQLRDAKQRVAEETAKLNAAEKALGATQDSAQQKAARLRLINKDLGDALGNQRGTATDLQKAQAKLNDAWEKFSTTIGPAVVGALGFIINSIATLVGWLVDLINFLGKTETKAKSLYDTGKALPGATYKPGQASGAPTRPFSNPGGYPGRASGGPVLPGMTYMVGENGPETLRMGNSGGYVIPSAPAPHAPSGMTQITTIVQVDGKEIARQMDRYLHRSIGMAGTGIRRPMGG